MKGVRNEIVRLEDIWVYLEDTLVLEAIDLTIHQNDYIGLIGPNGGGKTTLLKVILGLIEPTRGTVTVFGGTPKEGRKRIGYIPQYAQFDREFPISVLDTVLMGRAGRRGLFRRYTEEDIASAEKALQTVELSRYRDKQIGRLSGGQIQRVFIARALVSNPDLLLLDEPTASVDKYIETEVYDLLDELQSKMAIVIVSHDIGVISVHVKKFACLNHRLFYCGEKKPNLEMIEDAYKCPIDFISHGKKHRVLRKGKK